MRKASIATLSLAAIATFGALPAFASAPKQPAPTRGADSPSVARFARQIQAEVQKNPEGLSSFDEALARIVPDVKGLPRCLSPVHERLAGLASRSTSLASALGAVLAPPALSQETVHVVDGGDFAVHYTLDRSGGDGVLAADADANGVPDYVDTVSEALVESRTRIVTTLSFRDPAAAGPVQVHLANLGGRIDGYTVASIGNRSGFIVLDSRLLGNDALLRAAVAHQVAHAVLLEYGVDAPAWWSEASAAWLEGIVAGSYAHLSESIRAATAASSAGLGIDDVRILPGRLLWPAHLAGLSGGPQVVRAIWEMLEAQGDAGDVWSATDQVLRGVGSSLEREFTIYSLGLVLEREDQGEGPGTGLVLSGDYASYPAAELQTGPAIGAFGSAFVRFAADGSEGGLRITLDGDAPGQFQAHLLLTPRRKGDPLLHATVLVDPRGHGSIGIPWATYSEAIMIIDNVMRSGSAATYSFTARPDPTFPFELTSFSAEADDADVRLTWDTQSEDGLFGWIVYRSERTDGAPHRVNDLVVPAIGDGDGPVSYQFLDDGVAKGRTYYYRLVGVTYEGLTREVPSTRIDLPR